MRNNKEESKGSTSSEEPEYESDINSIKSGKSASKPSKSKITPYLSTNLITETNLTLPDIIIQNYTMDQIEDLE